MSDETLIEHFKRYYFDYRKTSDSEESFRSAKEAIAHYVIQEVGVQAEEGDLGEIRDVLRQYREIRDSTYGSNDSVMERFEAEYQEERV